MSDKRFGYGETPLFEWVEEDGKMISTKECVNKLNEQQVTISALKEENEQLKNELMKEKSLREYSDSMYGKDLIVNIRFSNGEWKADVSVIDNE